MNKGIDFSRKQPSAKKEIPISKLGELERFKGVPVEREGVFEHIFKCIACGLHFKVYSWQEFRHTEDNVYCPECGQQGGMFHNQKTISSKKEFDVTDLEHEICGYVEF